MEKFCVFKLIVMLITFASSSLFAMEIEMEAEVDRLLSMSPGSDILEVADADRALFSAVLKGDEDGVQLARQEGANVNFSAGEYGYSMLIFACINRHSEIAIILIGYGAEVDFQDIHGFTALHHAAFIGDVNIVKILLESGADAMKTGVFGGMTPLDLIKKCGEKAEEDPRITSGRAEVRLILEERDVQESIKVLEAPEFSGSCDLCGCSVM